MISANM